MGAIDESVQSLFPYRGADVHDWLVDVCAAVVTCAILWLLLPKAAFERKQSGAKAALQRARR